MSQTTADFANTMVSFILWSLRSKGLTAGPKGEPLDQLAWQTFVKLLEPVRGNRSPDVPLGLGDQTAIMDAVAQFHLELSRS